MSSTEPSLPESHTLLTGLVMGESPRWHDHRLWFSDFGANQVRTVDLEGVSEVVAPVPGMPMGLGFLPDGRLLIVSARDGLLLRREPDGSAVTHADLTAFGPHPWSDMVVDGRGNAYVGNPRLRLPGRPVRPRDPGPGHCSRLCSSGGGRDRLRQRHGRDAG